MEAIKMFSATDGWMVGNGIWHYDGHTWTKFSSPVSGFTIAATSPSSIWIGSGSMVTSSRPALWHYDGHSWAQQSTPVVPGNAYANISSISMVSAEEGWAVGTAGIYTNESSPSPTPGPGHVPQVTGFILHYISGQWRLAQTLPGVDLHTISMGSVTDGWAGGDLRTEGTAGEQDYPRLLHYTGGRWEEVTMPGSANASPASEGEVSSITMFSPNEGWMVATPSQEESVLVGGNAQLSQRILHYEYGRWTDIERPVFDDRRQVSMISLDDTRNSIAFVSPSEFWIVGAAIWWTGAPRGALPATYPTVTPMIARYKNSAWSIYQD
jgi:hypothetical protein